MAVSIRTQTDDVITAVIPQLGLHGPDSPPATRKNKILIVEDDLVFALELAEQLKRLGYEVCGHADTCEGALSQARKLEPDMVLMDIHLNGVRDGIDAAKEIHIESRIPVVFLTAESDDATLARVGEAEPFGYVVKPFEERKLKATLEVALSRSKAESRVRDMERWLSIANAQLMEAQDQLQFMVYHDTLTGCYSRQYLDHAFQHALSEMKRGYPGSLLSIDVDDFKIVNDVAGHLVGDQFLVACANLIMRSVRPEDEVIRIGGDEFLVVLNHIDYEASCDLAETIRRNFAEFSFFHNTHHFAVTVSIGITQIHPDSSQEQLISWSDSACYSAKRLGRNCVIKHDVLEVEREVFDWKQKIQDAILEDRFDVWFQPILEISTNKILMQESLLRPRNEEGLFASPMPYLKAAERYRIAPIVDRHIIQKVIYYLKSYPAQNVTINLSAQSISNTEMFEYIEQLFSMHPSFPSRVCFEITETTLISDIQKASELMHQLHEVGFQFAIDDFGAGFSSFNYFRKLPIQYLKIDGSYIVKLEEEPVNQAVVRGINLIAHELNIRTVAEHVETAATLAVLADLNIDFAQGYFTGRPTPWK